ncbi:hypothetical protein BOX15_Mlig001419g5, partial [Macrostomum lignano]
PPQGGSVMLEEPQFPVRQRSAHKNFGTLAVLCGCSLALLEVLAIVMRSGYAIRGTGLWCGAVLLLSGGLAVSAATARHRLRRRCLAAGLVAAAALLVTTAAATAEAATLAENRRLYERTRMRMREQAYLAVFYLGVAKTVVECLSLLLSTAQLVCLLGFYRRLLSERRAGGLSLAAVTEASAEPLSLRIPQPRPLEPPPYSPVADPLEPPPPPPPYSEVADEK